MPAAAADADAARQQRASKLASANPEPEPEPEPELEPGGGEAGPSVEEQRAAELKDSVYWRHRGTHHIKPPPGAAAVEAALDEAAACIAAADGLLFITGTPRVPALRPEMTGRGHAVRVTTQGWVTF